MVDYRERRIRGWGRTYRASADTIEAAVRSGTSADAFIRSITSRAPEVTAANPTPKPAQLKRSNTVNRESEIRRMARKAGLPKFGERHIRAGTSPDDFFLLVVDRLSGGAASATRSDPLKRKSVTDEAEMAAGAAAARALRGTVVGEFAAFASIGRDAKHDDEDGDEDGEREEPADDDDQDEEDDHHDEDDADDEEDKETERRRGERETLKLIGRGGSGGRLPTMAVIREQRQAARRAVDKRVDDALALENGRRQAERLLKRGKA